MRRLQLAALCCFSLLVLPCSSHEVPKSNGQLPTIHQMLRNLKPPVDTRGPPLQDHTQQAGRRMSASDPDATGGLYAAPVRTSCEVWADEIEDAEACSVDEFVSFSRSIAKLIECTFLNANAFLENVAKQLESVHEGYDKGSTSEITADHLSTCPNHRMLYYNQTKAGRQSRKVDTFIIPQPPYTKGSVGEIHATGYTINGSYGSASVVNTDVDKINRGLSLGSTFGVLGDHWADIYKTKGSKANSIDLVYYVHSDPNVVAMVPSMQLGANGEAACALGAPEVNYFYDDIWNWYLRGASPQAQPKTNGAPIMRPYWSRVYGDYNDVNAKLVTSGSMAVLDENGMFQGAVAVDYNIDYLNEQLEQLSLSPNTYALIVAKDGRSIAATRKAIDTLFFPDMSLVELRGGTAYANCGQRPEDQRAGCSDPELLPITDVATNPRYSGADFSELLEHLFDPSYANCSSDKNLLPIRIANVTHLVFFCALSDSIPGWGIIVGAPIEEVNEAATFTLELAPDQAAKVSRENDDGSEHTVIFDVVLQNTGRFALPYSAKLDKDAPWASLVQNAKGLLDPNKSVEIQVQMETKNLGASEKYGVHAVVLEVVSQEVAGRGYCFHQAQTVAVKLENKAPPDNTAVILITVLVFLWFGCAVALGWFVRFVCRQRAAKLKLLAKMEATMRKRLEDGVRSVKLLAHPMVLIGASSFMKLPWDDLKGLHEGVRNLGDLMFLDSIEAIAAFKEEGHVIIFFSYQWLSWISAGPNEIQLSCMKGCLETLCAMKGVAMDRVTIWLDILAIPQRCFDVKTLAVDSLYTYARYADVLIIITPSSIHEALGTVANTESYKRRIWCRMEQLAFFCNRGLQGMFQSVSPGQLQSVPSDWMDDVAVIFDGEMTCCTRKHEGGALCDKLSIVQPVLGMYFDLYVKKKLGLMDEINQATWAFIENHKDSIFPETFMYNTETGGNEVFEERTLFGDIIKKTDEFVDQDLDAAQALSSASIDFKVCQHEAHSNLSIVLPRVRTKAIEDTKQLGSAQREARHLKDEVAELEKQLEDKKEVLRLRQEHSDLEQVLIEVMTAQTGADLEITAI